MKVVQTFEAFCNPEAQLYSVGSRSCGHLPVEFLFLGCDKLTNC